MGHDLFFYTFLLLAGLWLGMILSWLWPQSRAAMGQLQPTAATRAKTPTTPPKPLAGRTTSHAVKRVSMPPRPTSRLPLPCRLCSRAPEDVGERLTRSSPFVLTRIVPSTAGWDGAISAATAIPVIDPGGNFSVSRVTPPARRRTARRCTASVCHPNGSWGPWALSRKAWASVPWRGCSRSPPIP